MNVIQRTMLGILVTSLLAVPLGSSAARADHDRFDGWKDYHKQLKEERKAYEKLEKERRKALEKYWKKQRKAEKEFAKDLRRHHNRHAGYGPHHAHRLAPAPYPNYFYDSAPRPGCDAHDAFYGAEFGAHRGGGGAVAIGPLRVYWD